MQVKLLFHTTENLQNSGVVSYGVLILHYVLLIGTHTSPLLFAGCCIHLSTPYLCPVRALESTASLIHLLISALYIYCLLVYIVCFPAYPFFFTFLLTKSFPLRIDPLRFQAGGCKR